MYECDTTCSCASRLCCTLCRDMVQCVFIRLISCPSMCGFCVWGAAPSVAWKDSPPPSREGEPGESPHQQSCRPPRRSCRKGPGLYVQPPSHSVDPVGCGWSGHARAAPAFQVPGSGQRRSSQERPPAQWSLRGLCRWAPPHCSVTQLATRQVPWNCGSASLLARKILDHACTVWTVRRV